MNNMDYVEISPPKEISSYIKCFWEYKNENEVVHHTIFPNGYFELFMLYEKQELVSVFLSGLRTKPFDAYIPKGMTVFAIRFLLPASEYIFEKEIGSILNDTMQLDIDFWQLQTLSDQSFYDRTTHITHKLINIIDRKEIDRDKLSLLTTVYTPDLTVQNVSDIIHWEPRRINRYFNKQFGLSLKTFLSIIRLRSSFDSIKDGILYPELNYYDQSHYIKEVRKYTGESPKHLLNNENDRYLQFSIKAKP